MEGSGTILYIEPHKDSREVLAFFLESQGFSVVAVKNPREALDKLRAGSFQLILLDCATPDGPGEEFCRVLGEMEIKLPMVFFSSWAHPQARKNGFLAGASFYLVKPNDFKDLVPRLRSLLK